MRGTSPGERRGGRQQGTPNKLTQALTERLAALGYNPIEGMARIPMEESQRRALRAGMYRELAQYVAPKRKALEHKGKLAGSSLTCICNRHRQQAGVGTG
jgi:hypothetical protein